MGAPPVPSTFWIQPCHHAELPHEFPFTRSMSMLSNRVFVTGALPHLALMPTPMAQSKATLLTKRTLFWVWLVPSPIL